MEQTAAGHKSWGTWSACVLVVGAGAVHGSARSDLGILAVLHGFARMAKRWLQAWAYKGLRSLCQPVH